AKRAVEGFWSPNPAKSRFRKPNLNLNTSEWPVVQRLHDGDHDEQFDQCETMLAGHSVTFFRNI
ncbi:MAG: hypothetical protein ABFD96_24020, partial [Armatimonadia bacterium]